MESPRALMVLGGGPASGDAAETGSACTATTERQAIIERTAKDRPRGPHRPTSTCRKEVRLLLQVRASRPAVTRAASGPFRVASSALARRERACSLQA